MVVPAKGSTNNTTLWPPLSIDDIIRSPNVVWLPFGFRVETASISWWSGSKVSEAVHVSPWIGSN